MNLSINISQIPKPHINLFISKHFVTHLPKSSFDKERFKLLCKIVIKSEIAFIEKLDKDYFKKMSLDNLKRLDFNI